MNIINTNIKTSEFLDNCGYYLSCFERPICLLLDSMKPNSSLYLLLFKDLTSEYEGNKIYSYIEDKTGIAIIDQVKQGNDFTNELIRFINDRKNIILITDLFYDSRYPANYKKIHHQHCMILKGYDSESKSFLVIDEDPYTINFTCKANYWPYLEVFIKEDLLKEICVNLDYDEVIKNDPLQATGGERESKFYNYIELIDKYNKHLNIYDIISSYKYIINSIVENYTDFKSTIINNVMQFQSGYDFNFNLGEYPSTLDILYKHNDSIHLQYKFFEAVLSSDNDSNNIFKQKFLPVCQYYQNAYSLLVKYSFSKNTKNIEKSILNLNMAFEKEEKLYKYILTLLDEINPDDFSSIKNIICEPKITNKNITKFFETNRTNVKVEKNSTQYCYIDINEYFNNIAFGTLESDIKCTADFTGRGHFYIPEGLSCNEIWSVMNMQFKFPQVGKCKPDNISCIGQKILVPDGLFSKVCLLGCSEYGNFESNFKVIYKNGDKFDFSVSFSDWSFPPSSEGEYIAFDGFFGNMNDKHYDYGRRGIAKIFAREHNLLQTKNEIESIILPDCPSMHLFAITLF